MVAPAAQGEYKYGKFPSCIQIQITIPQTTHFVHRPLFLREAMEYICADCSVKNEIKPPEPIRCRDCGHRVMYKKEVEDGDAAESKPEAVDDFNISAARILPDR
ncbi:hypothetical protein C8R46DRAFT_987663 [Mycena filopes]|nr:hypothetical protein C8R46DRAFT_987663 [Mycena filopes]